MQSLLLTSLTKLRIPISIYTTTKNRLTYLTRPNQWSKVLIENHTSVKKAKRGKITAWDRAQLGPVLPSTTWRVCTKKFLEEIVRDLERGAIRGISLTSQRIQAGPILQINIRKTNRMIRKQRLSNWVWEILYQRKLEKNGKTKAASLQTSHHQFDLQIYQQWVRHRLLLRGSLDIRICHLYLGKVQKFLNFERNLRMS